MKYSIVTFISLAALVLSSEAAISRSFKLKTLVINAQQSFNNQYISAYHTGPGTFVAWLTKNADWASVGYINGTTVNFHCCYDYYYLWLALVTMEDWYTGWAPITFNITNYLYGAQSTDSATNGYSISPVGFFTKKKGDESQFNGWRVCDWAHGVPELFYRTPLLGGDIPCSCADVHLVPEYQ